MNQNFSTYDLGLTATLITLKYELLELDKTNTKKINFIFKEKKDIREKADDYFSGKLKVEPQELFNNIKMIKNRIYSNY